MKYDFSGWATRNNIRCSDGRTILKDAFKQHDGQTVPLVWNHQHNESANVLGHAVLENRDEGVYAYCTFNDTEAGKNAKLLVEHGDVTALSIYANQLKQKGSNVMHGTIREVSLVLAGANPGAFIDSVIRHGEFCDDEAVIYTGEELILQHADDPSDKADKKDKKGDDEVDNNEKTIQDVFDTLNEEQKNVVYALIGQALEDKEMAQSAIEENENNIEEDGGEQEMKHNVFEGRETENNNVLSHDAMDTILKDAKRYGSLKESFLAHADDYGIKDIEWLFPDAKNVNTPPDFIKRDDSYVQKVMRGVHHVPFSRIKSMFADITADQARAKGYIKGNLKKEEVFTLLKRTTTPTTIYKKQKLDRDDVVDITDFDVVAWLKMEMRMMLDEEIARAILVGDGRSSSDDDKINEMNIRPISRDEDLYCVKAPVAVAAAATEDEIAKAFIRTVIKSRKEYKGSGSPTLFTTEDVITNCLLLEDKNGRVIYDTVDKLATALRVKEIVPVEVMENAKTMVNKVEKPLMAIMVNLVDYYVGADKGGAINMFDDFDIDYNQQKYLMETRCSGALVKPFSAIAVALDQAAAAGTGQ
jgi:HK97 family phage prohead protease|nr:MAG TPA: major capsid protein [Caudoviricetes sp.]